MAQSVEDRFDILSSVPLEISHLIIKYFSIQTKTQCFYVSRKWRSLLNYDDIWKVHCEEYGLIKDKSVVTLLKKRKSDICPMARLWFSYRFSPTWAMLNYRPTISDVKVSKTSKICARQDVLIVCRPYSNYITVYNIHNSVLREFKLDLPFKITHWDRKIDLGDSYIAVAYNNVVVGFKKDYLDAGGVQFKQVCCLSVSNDQENIKKIKGPIGGVFRNCRARISVCGILEKYVWLRQDTTTFTIKLVSSRPEIKKIPEININDTLEVVNSKYMCAFTYYKQYKAFKLFQFAGSPIFSKIHPASTIHTNGKIVLTFYETNNAQVMQTWCIKTRNKHLESREPLKASYEIHPEDDVIFKYDSESDYIYVLDAINGSQIWKLRMPFPIDDTLWHFHFFSKRYLYIYKKAPQSDAKEFFVLDIFTKMLRRYGERPNGEVISIYETFIVTQAAQRNRIFIQYY